MHFDLTADQRSFQAAARQFAERELAPHAARWDRENHFPRSTIAAAAAMGFCGLYCDEDSGGMGLSRLDASLIFEELAAGCTSTAAYISIHNMVAWMVTAFGSTMLRQRYGSALCSGEMLASYCLTEPGAGSDAASLRMTARRTCLPGRGECYLLNGSKAFISGAGATEVLVVMARSGEDGSAGISSFVVPTTLAGISYGQQERKLGWHSQPTAMIHFNDVALPVDHLLGEEGEGFRIAMRGLDGGRINIGACSLGAAEACLRIARGYVLEREQFGRKLAAFQGLQFKLADMLTQLVAARQLLYLAAYKLDRDAADKTRYCAMAKRLATDAGFTICNEALQLLGGYGYLADHPVERYLRDCRVHQILEGTNEIMRVIIARDFLKEVA